MPTLPELVPIYFRQEDRLVALRLAVSLEEDREGSATVSPVTIDEHVVPGWTREQIELSYVQSAGAMELIFDGMIGRPDEVLEASDLLSFLTEKLSYATAETLRGTMGAFANRCVSRYGRDRRDFPFRHWYVEGGYARYQMPSAVAEILRPLRDAARA